MGEEMEYNIHCQQNHKADKLKSLPYRPEEKKFNPVLSITTGYLQRFSDLKVSASSQGGR